MHGISMGEPSQSAMTIKVRAPAVTINTSDAKLSFQNKVCFTMAGIDTFGAQQGYGSKVVEWMNEQAAKKKKKSGAELYGHVIETSRFGKFEMISWNGETSVARELIVRASKRYTIKTLEGGYKPKSFFSFSVGSKDYAKVYYNGSLIGYIELTKSRLPGTKWSVTDEKAS